MEEHDTLVVQVESGAQEALDKRNEGEEPLVIEQDELQAKLDAVKAQIEENRVHKEKLIAVIADCHEMKQLPPERKGSSYLRENLKQTLMEVKEEVIMADSFLQRTKASKAEGQRDKVMLIHEITALKTVSIVDNDVNYHFLHRVRQRHQHQRVQTWLQQLIPHSLLFAIRIISFPILLLLIVNKLSHHNCFAPKN